MQVDLDDMIDKSKEKILQFQEQIKLAEDRVKLEEMYQERLLLEKREVLENAAAQPTKAESRNGGHRPLGLLVNGSLLSRIIKVMTAEGGPMRAGEIAKRLESQGFRTAAKSGLPMVISSTLGHHEKDGKHFNKVKTGLYDLLERQIKS